LDNIKGDLSSLENGAVLYSFHFGIWEAMPQALARLGYRLAIIVNRYSEGNGNLFARLADRLLFSLRSRNGIKVMYREDTREIVEFIRKRGIFGILVDGDRLYAKFHKAAKLARMCDVPLVPFAAYQDKGVGTLELGANIERSVRNRPYDYWWFYKSRERAWSRTHGAHQGSVPLGASVR
jgi:lauroyl/myristoyl acyltransferase